MATAKRLSFVCADERAASVMLNKAALKRAGPVLSGLVEDCAPDESGTYVVRVPELKTTGDVVPLVLYLRGRPEWDSPWARGSGVYESYMLATGRLDVPGFARAVESQLLDALKGGKCQLDAVARTYRGCPRVEALCDHYASMVGRAPPAYEPLGDVASLAGCMMAEPRGVVLVVGEDEFWVVANVGLCRDMSGDSVVCRRVAKDVPVNRRLPEADAEDSEDESDGDDSDDDTNYSMEWDEYVIYAMDEDATIRNYPDLEPSWPRSWLSTTRGLEVSATMTGEDVNSFFEGRHVQLVVLPDVSKGNDSAEIDYSRDMLSDFLFEHGAGRRFGGHPHEYE